MTFFAKLGALFLAPFLAFSSFFGLHAQVASTTPVASTTITATSSSSANATSTQTIEKPIVHNPLNGGTTNITSGVAITSVTPSAAPVGAKVTLYGTGFAADSIVHFGPGAIQNVTISADGSQLTFTVPDSAGPYCKAGEACPMYAVLITAGTYGLSVENGKGISNTVSFNVTQSAQNPSLQ